MRTWASWSRTPCNGRDTKVHLCRDGKEGLRYFNEHPYDLCILDVMLPNKDRFSLAEDIRTVNAQVPIVFPQRA